MSVYYLGKLPAETEQHIYICRARIQIDSTSAVESASEDSVRKTINVLEERDKKLLQLLGFCYLSC